MAIDIERLKENVSRWPGSTHWDGCEYVHESCALLALVERVAYLEKAGIFHKSRGERFRVERNEARERIAKLESDILRYADAVEHHGLWTTAAYMRALANTECPCCGETYERVPPEGEWSCACEWEGCDENCPHVGHLYRAREAQCCCQMGASRDTKSPEFPCWDCPVHTHVPGRRPEDKCRRHNIHALREQSENERIRESGIGANLPTGFMDEPPAHSVEDEESWYK